MTSSSSPSASSNKSPAVSSEFFFCLCQEGVEKILREELLAAGYAPSFSSAGFVTAKAQRPITVAELPRPVLARRVCLSLGKDLDVDQVAREQGADGHSAIVHGEDTSGPAGDDASAHGDVVVTHLVRGGSVWVGVHEHKPGLSPSPCGKPDLSVPSSAPSRAWLKLEEAARLWSLPLNPGDAVVEVGCAPGGVTRALLDRGYVVVGIDPNAMDERILADPRFTHLRCSAQQAFDLPQVLRAPARLLVVDINQRPHAAIDGVGRVIEHTRDTLRGALFTLKLGSWDHFGELPRWRNRLERELKMSTWVTQLPANRQELCVFCSK